MLGYCLIVLQCFIMATANDFVYPCTTPNNERAYCVSLFNCPGLMRALGSLQQPAVDFVRNSACLFGNITDFPVCCGKSDLNIEQIPNATNTSKTTDGVSSSSTTNNLTGSVLPKEKVVAKSSLLPSRRYCGYQHTDDRLYNGTSTALDEFPWLVHVKITNLEYDSEFADRCSGIIINKRYVLTDSYCAFSGIKVLIGQHTTDQNVSCTQDRLLPECTEPTQELKIEEKIQMGKKANGPFDLSLIRLNQSITFTDYIRPICLPFIESERPQPDQLLVFSGWGSSGNSSVVKKRLTYAVANNEVCYQADPIVEGNVKFANVTLLCVIARNNSNTEDGAYYGDHGGALMYKYRHQWFVQAIVITVHDIPNQAASSIKITPDVLKWIVNTVKN